MNKPAPFRQADGERDWFNLAMGAVAWLLVVVFIVVPIVVWIILKEK